MEVGTNAVLNEDRVWEGGSYNIEVKIPLEILPAGVGPTSTPPTGDAATNVVDPLYMGLNVTPYDSDRQDFVGNRRMAWSPFGAQQAEPYRWGHAYLEGYTPPADRPTTPADPIVPDTAMRSVESPQTIHPIILQGLGLKGANPSNHVQRKLTRELLEAADLPVAMGLDHQEYVRVQFAREILLFNQICYERSDPVLDIHEAITDWHVNMDAAYAYALSLVDYIWNAMPAFLDGLDRLKQAKGHTDRPLRHD
jgi:protein-tyrosine-phosphatase